MEKNILIIDNDIYDAKKMEEYLNSMDFETTITKNGQFGLSSIRSKKPALILLSDRLIDISVEAFLERKSKMLGMEKIPVIVLSRSGNDQALKHFIKKGASDIITKPVVLERLRKKIFPLLKIPDISSEKHLVSEVFMRDGIIVIEIGGFLVPHEIMSMKYVILDTARTDQTLTKRFYIIIYSLDQENIPQEYFDKLFDFISHFPGLPKTNVKILTSDEKIKKMLKNGDITSEFEIVENYINGLNKLKSLYLSSGGGEILVEFLKPDILLYKNVYDNQGRLIKKEGKSFNQAELEKLLKMGIKKLYYTRTARVGEDKQISEDEDVDVVMDAIQVTGVVIPEDLTDLSLELKSNKKLLTNILIVNGSQQELNTLYAFFKEKGFPVEKATNSKEAIEISAKKNLHYILVDLNLDNGNGLNLVRSLKLQRTTKNASFILTGKNVTGAIVNKAIQLGVRGFLTSPFNPEKLSQMIK